jgi:hypothetical protein
MADIFDQVSPDGDVFDKVAPDEKSIKRILSGVYHPVLEAGGAIGGGLLGAGAASATVLGVPVGATVGGALGLAGGKSAADAIDRTIGLQEPIDTVAKAVKQTGADLKYGAIGEATGAALGPAKKAIGAVLGGGGKVGRGVAQMISGREAKRYAQLAKDPAAILPEALGGSMSKGKAGEQLGKVLAEENLALETNPFFDTGGVAKDGWQKIQLNLKGQGPKPTAQEMYEIKRGVDEVMSATPWVKRINNRLWRDRTLFKKYLTEELGNYSGKYAKASKDYARSALGSDFLTPFPVNQGGTPSIMRTGIMSGLAALVGVPAPLAPVVGAVASSPLALGLGTAGIGAVSKGVGKVADTVIQNPSFRRGVVGSLGLGRKREREQ